MFRKVKKIFPFHVYLSPNITKCSMTINSYYIWHLPHYTILLY